MRTRIAAIVIALCVGVLTVDYVVARVRAPKDDRLVKALQQQVKNDPAASAMLDSEFKRITAYRRARKLRDGITADILIGAAAAFLLLAKRTPRRFPLPQKTAAGGRNRTLVPRAAADSTIDLSFVEESVARLGRTREAAIPLLQAIQTHYRYLPDEALRRVCELTEITPAQIAGTSSFYGQFRRSPVGKHLVKVCHGTACHVSGARQITGELRRSLAIPEGADTDPSRTFTIEEVACLGCCSLAPVLMVDEHTAGKLTPSTACDALDAAERKETA
jgi:NADH:ubiquinone oxidoreductase subunit E